MTSAIYPMQRLTGASPSGDELLFRKYLAKESRAAKTEETVQYMSRDVRVQDATPFIRPAFRVSRHALTGKSRMRDPGDRVSCNRVFERVPQNSGPDAAQAPYGRVRSATRRDRRRTATRIGSPARQSNAPAGSGTADTPGENSNW